MVEGNLEDAVTLINEGFSQSAAAAYTRQTLGTLEYRLRQEGFLDDWQPMIRAEGQQK